MHLSITVAGHLVALIAAIDPLLLHRLLVMSKGALLKKSATYMVRPLYPLSTTAFPRWQKPISTIFFAVNSMLVIYYS